MYHGDNQLDLKAMSFNRKKYRLSSALPVDEEIQAINDFGEWGKGKVSVMKL